MEERFDFCAKHQRQRTGFTTLWCSACDAEAAQAASPAEFFFFSTELYSTATAQVSWRPIYSSLQQARQALDTAGTVGRVYYLYRTPAAQLQPHLRNPRSYEQFLGATWMLDPSIYVDIPVTLVERTTR